MRSAEKWDMFEELKTMTAGSRIVEIDGASFLIGPDEPLQGMHCSEWFLKRDDGSIVDARSGDIVWPVEDE